MSELTVRYGQIVAVRGATFTLERGDAVVLTGPNGAGKTSTLCGITGIAAAQGTVELDGRALDGMSADQRARAGIALVRDGRRVFGRLTVAQNLAVGAAAVRGRAAARDAIAGVLQRFPILSARAAQRAETLSGGEAQMLTIARALVTRPQVLLVDEPFQGLSAESSALVLAALHEIAAEGAVVLCASPDPIEGMRAVHIRHGHLAEVLA